MEVVILTSTRVISSLEFALETLDKADKERKGMRVYPDEYSKARNDLAKLKAQIEREMKE